MTVEKVDFYLLDNPSPEQELIVACRLSEKAYDLGLHVHIQTRDPGTTAQLDDLLWTFNQQSFIPHQQSSEENELCAVTLHHDWQPHNNGLLINLADDIPPYFEQFHRIAEIIAASDARIEAGRQHYRFYKLQGIEPSHHKVG